MWNVTRKGIKKKMVYTKKYNSPIGVCLLAADDKNLIGLWFEGQKYYCPISDSKEYSPQNEILKNTESWLNAYFEGRNPSISEIPLMPRGSDFQQEVWRILCEIPYGEVITYGEIAKIIARKQGKERMSAQAVGGAVGHNPISIIIPCHRVIGANQSLTGYAGGVNKKRWLLKHEQVSVT